MCRWVVAGQETEDAAGGFSRDTRFGEHQGGSRVAGRLQGVGVLAGFSLTPG